MNTSTAVTQDAVLPSAHGNGGPDRLSGIFHELHIQLDCIDFSIDRSATQLTHGVQSAIIAMALLQTAAIAALLIW